MAPPLWCSFSRLAEFQLATVCFHQLSHRQRLGHVTAALPTIPLPDGQRRCFLSSFALGVDSSCFPPGDCVTSRVAPPQGFSRIFAAPLGVQRRKKITWDLTCLTKYQSHHGCCKDCSVWKKTTKETKFTDVSVICIFRQIVYSSDGRSDLKEWSCRVAA